MNYPVPKASAEAWQAYQETTRPRNVGLIFDRFVRDWGSDPDKEAKQKAWQEIAAQKADASLLKEWDARWEVTVRAAHAEPFSLTTDWRFVAGLGRKGPLEVGFTFQRYGFPILPGSSVKGIARAHALYQLAERLNVQDLNDLDGLLSEDNAETYGKTLSERSAQATPEARMLADQFRVIFGTTGNAGSAVFFDAIPTSLPKLELDIMNPHFPNYYQGDQFPTDWQSPVPIYFLTVAAGTTFRFAVGWRTPPDAEARRLQALAQEWLVGGLTKLGAGAKTSAGYGYFQALPAAQGPAAIESAPKQLPPAPVQPARPATRCAATGKVRYESGKPVIRSEEGKRWRVNWKELGMNALKEKTLVEIEYDEFTDGTYKVVRVTRKGG